MRTLKPVHSATLLLALCLLLAAAALFNGSQPVRAQGVELIQNGGMDNYYGIGGSNVVPLGWTYQSAPGGISTAKQQWQFENQSYGGSWHISTQSVGFSMIGYQFLAGVRTGTPVRFSAAANIFTCNRQDSCIGGDGVRVSDRSSGAQARVGINPKGGLDAASADIVWSAWATPFDSFQVISVETKSLSDNGVTVFLNYTQTTGLFLNNVYWDNASALANGPVGAPGTPAPGSTPVPTVQLVVPYVTPQGAQADGSVVHVVKEGDTLSSIAVAYKVTLKQIRDLNGLPDGSSIISVGQKLIIKKIQPIYVIVTATNTPANFGAVTTADSTQAGTQASTQAVTREATRPVSTAPITVVTVTPRPFITNTPRPGGSPTPDPNAVGQLIPSRNENGDQNSRPNSDQSGYHALRQVHSQVYSTMNGGHFFVVR